MIIFAVAMLLTMLYAGNWDVRRVLRFLASPATDEATVTFETQAVAFLCDVFIVACVLVDLL